MNYNLFLDDFRNPKDVYNYLRQPIYISVDWEIVRNYDEFVKIIIVEKEFIFIHQKLSLCIDILQVVQRDL